MDTILVADINNYGKNMVLFMQLMGCEPGFQEKKRDLGRTLHLAMCKEFGCGSEKVNPLEGQDENTVLSEEGAQAFLEFTQALEALDSRFAFRPAASV